MLSTYDKDNNKYVDLVNLDFQKASDKAPFERLMLKVNAHGIEGDAARWIRNGLAGDSQWETIKQSYNNLEPVTSGVPQGLHIRHRARNPDDITELLEDNNKLVE